MNYSAGVGIRHGECADGAGLDKILARLSDRERERQLYRYFPFSTRPAFSHAQKPLNRPR